ncbi:protein SODIUM POTASSIUM ROOT DEFECTIVE 2-like [Dioscorea cayenensis subsp. rotundata]|uniref:Protein SODIUM POTASSIUM ROOT DEFECTIVE 2-like n=1 Tax=Dioscorea cayennensis subsp. rotundata TaxID=55577 RepID=A0AB40CW93_DIOCR|nr:protein SODIUM POTASSIUM ROOT DEFECTIVE 2-like [Dioscorea cayenensis subsp. rotundata]
MGRLISFERVLECFSSTTSCTSCLCLSSSVEDEDSEGMALMKIHAEQIAKLQDVDNGCKTLAFHLEPKTVVLRVLMHCGGCAKKVEKHISKMEGVSSCEVDLESNKVVVIGDITPFEVLNSVSKVKFAELWVSPP